MNAELYKEFRNPSNIYRGKPFWSWNGLLEKEELLKQIHVMHRMGFGGYFMHSRAGLETEYLGDEWFNLINACADEGQKLGMESWLYDEDRWPSGSAGGMVTENPQYRAKYLRLNIVDAHKFQWKDEAIAVFAAQIEGENLKEYQRISRDVDPTQLYKNHVLIFTTEEMTRSSNYNGYTYVDTLKREATEKFIELTHERYKKNCKDRLGKSIKGIFIDEPHRGQFMAAAGNINPNPEWLIPWTESLFDEFKKRFGYDVVNYLPEIYLAYKGSEVSQVRWHYIELLQQLFIENFVKPINDWCEENNLVLTGHFLHEDSLTVQTWAVGSIMRCYEHMGYPGVDVLTEGNRNFWIVKQLTSVARQLDQEWLLSELYGCTGWQMNLESHKEIGDWQALLGINIRCHHLAWYTMQGEAKRDYPSSILHQSSWWKDYKYVEDYFARIHLIMNQGKPCCNTLVINPIESVWAQARYGWIQGLEPGLARIENLEKKYRDIFYWLMGAHIDFDYGDEDMLARLYSIDIDEEGFPVLKIGQASYRQVLVSGMTTIRSTTLKIFEEFLEIGGRIVFAGEAPEYVDAVKSSKAKSLASKCYQVPFEKGSIIQELKDNLTIQVEVINEKTEKNIDDIYVQIREDRDNIYIFMLNVNLDKDYDDVKIKVGTEGFVQEWDCVTGERFRVNTSTGGQIEFMTDFISGGEHMYIITKHDRNVLPEKTIFRTKKTLETPNSFSYQLDEPNVLVLDLAKFRVDHGEWQKTDEILKVDRKIRDYFGMEYRGGEMIQPWYLKKEGYKNKGMVELSFEFYLEERPLDVIELVMERPENFKIKFNGHFVDVNKQNGYWIDICFKRIPIKPEWLVAGRNIIEVSTIYHNGIDIEAIYLLGNFGVKVENSKKTLTKLPEKLSVGDIVMQNLPFYSGRIKYLIPMDYNLKGKERAFLKLEKVDGACVKVSGGGNSSKMIAWRPYEVEITEYLKHSAEIWVEVVLTRRNTFGPLHQIPIVAQAYGPENFVTEGEDFTMDYMLVPAGLTTRPQIIVKEST